MQDLKQSLNDDLGRLVREYHNDGLPRDEIHDSLTWYADFARIGRVGIVDDDRQA